MLVFFAFSLTFFEFKLEKEIYVDMETVHELGRELNFNKRNLRLLSKKITERLNHKFKDLDSFKVQSIKKEDPNQSVYFHKENNSHIISSGLFEIKETLDSYIKGNEDFNDSYNGFLFFRSNLDHSILTRNKTLNVTLNEDYFINRCNVHQTCTSRFSKHELSDGVIISPFYLDLFTQENIISLASPIYFNDTIVGELVLDFDLRKYSPAFNKYTYSNHLLNHGRILEISNAKSKEKFKGELKYSTFIMLDNSTSLVFVVYLSVFIVTNLKAFVLIFILSILFVYAIAVMLELLEKTILENKKSKLCHLTEVLNRNEWEAFVKNNNNYKKGTLVMVDGNKIKHINDTYGHDMGDKAIKNIASVLKNNIRTEDVLFRVGGDEFIILMSSVSENIAINAMKRINKILGEQLFVKGLKLSISYGVAETNENETIEETLKKADKHMYLNKNLSQ